MEKTIRISGDKFEANPQKQYMKFICKLMYIGGLGNCWYEETVTSQLHKDLYFLWQIIAHFFLVSVIVSQGCSLLRNDLTVKEQSDAIQFIAAHPTVYLKVVFLILQRERIKNLFRKMFEDTRTIYTCIDLENAAIIKSKWYCFVLFFNCLICILTATIDGIIMHFTTGNYQFKATLIFLIIYSLVHFLIFYSHQHNYVNGHTISDCILEMPFKIIL